MDCSSLAMVKMVFVRSVLTVSRRIYAKSGMKVYYDKKKSIDKPGLEMREGRKCTMTRRDNAVRHHPST
jgi:hypothetical protein